jgi:hypothetical protein
MMMSSTGCINVLRNTALLTKMYHEQMPASLHPVDVVDAWMNANVKESTQHRGSVMFIDFLRDATESLKERLAGILDVPMLETFTKCWVEVATAGDAVTGMDDETSTAVVAGAPATDGIAVVDLTSLGPAIGQEMTSTTTTKQKQKKRAMQSHSSDLEENTDRESKKRRQDEGDEQGTVSRYQVRPRPILTGALRNTIRSVRLLLNDSVSLKVEVIDACSTLVFCDGSDDGAFLDLRDAASKNSNPAAPRSVRQRRIILPLSQTLKALLPSVDLSKNTHRFFRHLDSNGSIVHTRAHSSSTTTSAGITVEGLAEAFEVCQVFRKHLDLVAPVAADLLPKLRAWESGDDAALTIA